MPHSGATKQVRTIYEHRSKYEHNRGFKTSVHIENTHTQERLFDAAQCHENNKYRESFIPGAFDARAKFLMLEQEHRSHYLAYSTLVTFRKQPDMSLQRIPPSCIPPSCYAAYKEWTPLTLPSSHR